MMKPADSANRPKSAGFRARRRLRPRIEVVPERAAARRRPSFHTRRRPVGLAPLQLCCSALLNIASFGRIRVRGWSAQPIRTIN